MKAASVVCTPPSDARIWEVLIITERPGARGPPGREGAGGDAPRGPAFGMDAVLPEVFEVDASSCRPTRWCVKLNGYGAGYGAPADRS